jgi:hypothetical protein
VLISARSLEEYLAMFSLLAADLADRVVVDVAAGGADFTAGAAILGARAIAIDASYAVGPDALATLLDDSLGIGLTIVDRYPDRFTWRWYGDRAARDEARREAALRFRSDCLTSPSRYIAGQLPRLPLRDGAADLVLCSHLLFTWSDVLDREWHRAAILELARVGREVRIFPLVVQGSGDAVEWLPQLCDELRGTGLRVERREVQYEFQVGANQMLVVTS